MLTIRFNRVGKKNKPQFRIVLQEHTVAPGGRHVEVLGSHDPHQKKTVLKDERIKYWLSQGVQLSDTVYNLLVSKGLLEGEKRKVKMPKKEAPVETEEKKEETEKKEEKAVEGEAKTEEALKEEVKEEIKEEKIEEAKAE